MFKTTLTPNINPLLIKSKDIPTASTGPFKGIRNSMARASVRKYNQTIMNTQNAPIMQGILSAENVATRAIYANAAKKENTASKAANHALEKYNNQISGNKNKPDEDDEGQDGSRIH